MFQRKNWINLWVRNFVIFTLQVTLIICEPPKPREESNEELQVLVKKNIEHLKRLDNKTDMIYGRLDNLITKLDQVVQQNVNISHDVVEVKNILTDVPPGKTSSSPAKSCSTMNEHRFNMKSGHYWIEKNGAPIYEYCTMDEAGIPPRNPGSCKEWKEKFPESRSGLYNITIGEDSFEVVCEMETDSGGWLMVGSAVVKSNEEAREVYYPNIKNHDFKNLKNVSTGRFLLSMSGLNALYDVQPFHEVRMDCWKKYHNRRVNIKIVGHDSVQFLLGKTEKRRPQACGEFERLHNDTSFIGQNCHWDEGEYYEWGTVIIYDRPMYLWEGEHWHTITLGSSSPAYLYVACDDYIDDHPDNVGEWAYYIR